MLVFARKKGEEIVFPDLGITVKIIANKSAGITSIGIEAPQDIRVHRKEVWEKIQASGEDRTPAAATGAAQAVQLWARPEGRTEGRPERKGAKQS